MLKRNLVRIIGVTTVLACGSLYAQDPPDSRFFDSDGVRIHYIEEGSGEPIVLLHGNTQSVGQWLRAGVFQNLAKDYRVIAFDARGHGESDKPHETSAYGQEMALDIFRLLDHLKIARAHILGYSMGARVVGGAMPAHSERFLTAILGGFPPARNWSAEDQRNVEVRSENMLANPPLRLVEQHQDTRALAVLVLGLSALSVTDREMINVMIPTLGIVGSEDRHLQRMEELGRLVPGMKIVVIEGATHSGESDEPTLIENPSNVTIFLPVTPPAGPPHRWLVAGSEDPR